MQVSQVNGILREDKYWTDDIVKKRKNNIYTNLFGQCSTNKPKLFLSWCGSFVANIIICRLNIYLEIYNPQYATFLIYVSY